ncbi:MAG: hypothetical protein C4348_01925 [Patescibacteria group bacterium]
MESFITSSGLTIVSVVRYIINAIFVFLFLLVSFLFLYFGFKYLQAKSLKDVEESKKIVIYLILALILLSSAFFVPNLILNFLGLKVENLPEKGEILKPTPTIRIFQPATDTIPSPIYPYPLPKPE